MTAVERFWAIRNAIRVLSHNPKARPTRKRWRASIVLGTRSTTGWLVVAGHGLTQEAACAEALEKLEKAT